MKKFLVLISLALALVITPYQASAEPLHPYEQKLFEAFTKYPEQRAAITIAFWDYIEDDVIRVGSELPIPVGPFATIFEMRYNPGFIEYHIVVVPKYWDQALPTREQVVNHLCNDDRAVLYLVVFGGVMTYKSYRGNNIKSENTITVDGNDCRPGI
jgi:hypothetical protein